MSFIDSIPFFRWVKSPITDDQLAPLDSRCQAVQFCSALTENDHVKLAAFLRKHPKIPLRIYGHGITDLSCLKHYSFLAGIQIEVYRLESTDGIECLPDSLETFSLSQTATKKLSLGFLKRFKNLKNLYLESQSKDIEAISSLANLEQLSLRSITLPDLSCLMNLKKLWSLDIKLGGTKNLALLPKIGNLKYLEMWMIRGLQDISVIGEIKTLQFLFLQSLKNVTALPSFGKLQKLRRIVLSGMKGITDLSPLLTAKSLEDISLTRSSHLTPEAIQPLQKLSSLKAIDFGLGTDRDNRAVAAMLPKLQHSRIKYPFVFQ